MSIKPETTARIMIVDDIPANLRLLGDILKDHGYKVMQFPNAQMALDAALKQPPDLFLLDIMMPEITGFELNQQIKSTSSLKDIPVIFISALTDVENKVQAFQQGGVDYITKPFEAKEVLARVETQIAYRNARIQVELYNNHLEQLVEERTKDLYQAEKVANIGSWKFDFKSGSVIWSPQIYTIFNWDKNESISVSKIIENVHPDDRDSVVKQWENASVTGNMSSEHRIWVGSEFKWVSIKAIVEFDDAGMPTIGIGTAQDIDKKKKLELQVSKLQKAIEQSPASIVITDVSGMIEYVNPAFCEVTGYEESEVIGQNSRILNSGHQSATFYQDMWSSLTGGHTWIGEFANRKKSGELYWERSVISPIVNENGKITNYVAIKENITSQKATQNALLESEARFRSIFEENTSIMYVVDANTGRFVDVNPRCVEFYKWSKDEFLDMKIHDINLDLEQLNQDFQLIKKCNRHHGIHTHKDKVGNTFNMEVFCGMMKINGKEMIHIISHDITNQKRYYDTILNQIELLKSIAWTQSHILRAPVVRLLGLMDLLKNKDFTVFDEDDLLEKIFESTYEIDAVIRDIAEMSVKFDETILKN